MPTRMTWWHCSMQGFCCLTETLTQARHSFSPFSVCDVISVVTAFMVGIWCGILLDRSLQLSLLLGFTPLLRLKLDHACD
jgi:hypothetical protein